MELKQLADYERTLRKSGSSSLPYTPIPNSWRQLSRQVLWGMFSRPSSQPNLFRQFGLQFTARSSFPTVFISLRRTPKRPVTLPDQSEYRRISPSECP